MTHQLFSVMHNYDGLEEAEAIAFDIDNGVKGPKAVSVTSDFQEFLTKNIEAAQQKLGLIRTGVLGSIQKLSQPHGICILSNVAQGHAVLANAQKAEIVNGASNEVFDEYDSAPSS